MVANFTLTLYSAYQICDELTIVSSAGSPCIRWFHYWFGSWEIWQLVLFIGGSLQLFVLGVGTFGGASRIDATSGAVLATAFSVSQGIETDLAITTIACTSSSTFDLLRRTLVGMIHFFAHRIDAAIRTLWLQRNRNVTTFLVRFHGCFVPFQYSSRLLSVENS